MTDVFLGVDGEMTGATMQPPGAKPNFQRFQLVQIGLAELSFDNRLARTPYYFNATIGYDTFDSEPEAMAIHGIPEDVIRSAARPTEVDAAAVNWLNWRGIRKAIPVGYSVGSFDMPYVRETLPELSRRLSMRQVDLNAVVFTISEITGRSYKAVKAAGKNYAEKMIADEATPENPGADWKAHNAAYDALVAIYSYQYFKSILVMREIHDHL